MVLALPGRGGRAAEPEHRGLITKDVLETIPTGHGFANYATLIPGVTMSNSSLNISQDVGGGTGYNFAFAAIHGGKAMDRARPQAIIRGRLVKFGGQLSFLARVKLAR